MARIELCALRSALRFMVAVWGDSEAGGGPSRLFEFLEPLGVFELKPAVLPRGGAAGRSRSAR